MITPMRHATLIVRAEDAERLLNQLGELGLLHLQLQPCGGPELESLHAGLVLLGKVIQKLETIEDVPPSDQPVDASAVLDALLKLHKNLRELKLLETKLVREARAWEAFGDIDPDTVRVLRAGGLHLGFYRANQPVLPEGCLWIQGKAGCGIAVGLTADLADLSLESVPLPVRGPRCIRERLARLHALEERYKREGLQLASALPALRDEQTRLRNKLDFHLARDGMSGDDALRWIEGFVPAEKTDALAPLAEAAGAALSLRAPEENDPTPTLLKQSKVVSWIQPVYNFLGVTPGYNEVDIGWSFLLFLSIFSGMIIGDAGYGFLLTAFVLVLNLLKPGTRGKFANLLLCMGGATLVWGLFSGNTFGMAEPPGFLAAFKIPALTETVPVMRLCFLLGASHLTLAHLWNLWRKRKSLQALAELGWIGSTWCMYFITGMMVLKETLPTWVTPVFAASATLIVVFMTPLNKIKTEWVQHMMLPLSFVNNFVDVVSYVRLYAVGMAGLALAQSFNSMILGDSDGRSWIVSGIMMIVLVLMHGLNFILAGLGVMVHGIRLNTLEFASHIGLTWSGIPYKPFSHRQPSQNA
jgi:V/A-type H+-transporting ATPase subunit I